MKIVMLLLVLFGMSGCTTPVSNEISLREQLPPAQPVDAETIRTSANQIAQATGLSRIVEADASLPIFELSTGSARAMVVVLSDKDNNCIIVHVNGNPEGARSIELCRIIEGVLRETYPAGDFSKYIRNGGLFGP